MFNARTLAVATGWGLVATIIWLSVTPAPIPTGIDEGDKLQFEVADMLANAAGVALGLGIAASTRILRRPQ